MLLLFNFGEGGFSLPLRKVLLGSNHQALELLIFFSFVENGHHQFGQRPSIVSVTKNETTAMKKKPAKHIEIRFFFVKVDASSDNSTTRPD